MKFFIEIKYTEQDEWSPCRAANQGIEYGYAEASSESELFENQLKFFTEGYSKPAVSAIRITNVDSFGTVYKWHPPSEGEWRSDLR